MKRFLMIFSTLAITAVIGLALLAGFGSRKTTYAKYKAIGSTVNWHEPSESQPYPNLKKVSNLWIYVSTKNQRVYLHGNGRVIYKMYCSTGEASSPTPKGTFHIQAQRGKSFYNAASGEGANYWVSWLDHGVYLFHSVPVTKTGQYIPSQAEKLGTPASHGCVRLTVADAYWMYKNIPYGTKVVIK
jgi:lipoprotein-anchoring transpeptidase ErfK/SrfK